MSYRGEAAVAGAIAAFWLMCSWRLIRLWASTRGAENGTRALIIALGNLLALRGVEIAYVSFVWSVPLVERMTDPVVEHSIKGGYLLINFFGVYLIWRLIVAWRLVGLPGKSGGA